jgi:hypothetical protein
MPIIDKSQRHASIALWVFLFLTLVLIASTRLLPFIDLPNHLAEATIFKYYEPANYLGQFYRPVPWYYPNTFHTFFCSLFSSVEWGNRLFHILCIIMLQLSVFLTIGRLNGNRWYGLLAILFTFNYNMTFGFVGFAISIPILILLFYFTLVYIQTKKLFLNFILASLLILLFFMHAQNALMGLALYGCMMMYHYRRSVKGLIAHGFLIPLPVVIFIFAWWFRREPDTEGSILEYLKQYYSSSYFQDFAVRFRIIVFDNFQLREGAPGLVIAAVFFACVLIPLVASRLNRVKWDSSPEIIYPVIFVLISSSCYLFAPDKLPGQTPIFQRFSTIVSLSWIILGSVWLQNMQFAWLRQFVIVAIATYTCLWFEYIYTFNEENKTFNAELFSQVEPEKKLAGLIYENSYRGRKVYIHFPNYFLVWKKGVVASKIIDYRFGVVRRVPRQDALPFYHELIGEDYQYMPQYGAVDYLLVRGEAPVADDRNLHEFTLMREAVPWKLFVSR